jgi:ribosome-associated protein
MQPPIREYYHLEEIWGGKAVRMKVGEFNTKLVKASEPEPAGRPTPRKAATAKTARKPASRTFDAKQVAAKKVTNKSAAYKRVAGKSPVRKAAPGTKAGVKAAAKKAPARKSTPRS